MRSKIAAVGAVAALALVVPVGSASAGSQTVGTSTCKVTVEYWEIRPVITSHAPFVTYTMSGNVGGGVACPLPPAPSVNDILSSISWT